MVLEDKISEFVEVPTEDGLQEEDNKEHADTILEHSVDDNNHIFE